MKLLGVTGLVLMESTIDTDGRVRSIRVIRSAHPLLDRAAIDAVTQWRYEPTQLNDVPVPVVLTATVNFQLTPPR